MVFAIPSKIIIKAILFFLYINSTYDNNTLNSENYKILPSNYTLDALVHIEVKYSCQTILDCSEGALECRKDNNNKSYCIYPAYVCINDEECYLLKKTISANSNDTNIVDNTIQYDNNDNNKELNQIYKDESSKLFINNGNIDKNNNNNNNNNNNIKDCSSDEDCNTNKCVLGKCQINIEALSYYCNNENTRYLCRKIKDLTNEEKIYFNNENCSLLLSSSSSSSFSLKELKYLLISAISISAIILLMVSLWIFNAKSKPLVDTTDPEDFSVVIF